MRSAVETREIRDLPVAPPQEVGEADLDYVLRLQAMSPLLRDDAGFLLCFSLKHLHQLLEPGHTRPLEQALFELQGDGDPLLKAFFDQALPFVEADHDSMRRTPLAGSAAEPLAEALRPEIRALARELIEPRLGDGEFEFFQALATPLPARLAARILGVHEVETDYFCDLVYSSVRGLRSGPLATRAKARADLAALVGYLGGLLERRRATPWIDFLSGFLARIERTRLSALERRMQIATTLLASADLSRLSLAAAAAEAITRPDQWRALRADPGRLKQDMAREAMRLEPPAGRLARIADRDLEIEGLRLPAGGAAQLCVITALRDPRMLVDADRYDPRRGDHPRLSPAFSGVRNARLAEALTLAMCSETLAVMAEASAAPRLAVAPEIRGLGGAREAAEMWVRL